MECCKGGMFISLKGVSHWSDGYVLFIVLNDIMNVCQHNLLSVK